MKNERQQENIVRFDRPGTHFAESTPLGNGRLGAMVFGGIDQERIILNESSLWSGSKEDSDREDAHKDLPQIRKLLLEGRNKEAQQLFMADFTCQGKGSGYANGAHLPFGCYQVLGTLRLSFFQQTSFGPQNEGVRNYRRELDLSRAVMFTEFDINEVKYRREVLASAPSEVIVIRISANRAASISFNVNLDRPECYLVAPEGNSELVMKGRLDNGTDGKGTRYACRVKVVNLGGNVQVQGCTIQVQKVDEALVFITAATNAKAFAGRNCDDEMEASGTDMKEASGKFWTDLLREHEADYRKYYDRMQLELGCFNPEKHAMSVEARLKAFQAGASDPGLEALYFNFGRYLFISSSRTGGLPANIQGIWAEEIQTPWNGDWHLNAQQMVYWPAEVCNLSELHEPYLKLTEALREPGAKTAKAYYNARGWVAHTFTNLWVFTSPGEEASWGSTTGSSAWQCQHLWDHYLFTGDFAYLQWAYPVMKEAALFYLDMLIEEPKHHWLVTAPTDSPENAFYTPEGDICQLCMGPAYDMELLRYLFKACIQAARILDLDEEFRRELAEKSKRLAPTRITSDGRIMEWLEDYREVLPYHRHISHLWGLYPGDEMTPEKTPKLIEAAKRTLKSRGDASPGWAKAYRQCVWARIQDGNEAYKYYRQILDSATFPNLLDRCYHASETEQPPIMPPLSDYNHPFQIDGNLGGTAGVVEMLLQSSVDYSDGKPDQIVADLHILPALPDAWPEGKVEGIRARGGFTVDIHWQEGKPVRIALHAAGGSHCAVRYGSTTVELRFAPTECIVLDSNLRKILD